MTSCATLRMLQSLTGYHQNFLGDFWLPPRMGALRNPPNRQGSNMTGTFVGTCPQAQPLPALPAATNRGWSNTTGVVR